MTRSMCGGIVLPHNDDEDFTEPRKLSRIEPTRGEGPTFYSISQGQERTAVDREWLIEQLVPKHCVAILSGWSSVGKTHIVNDLMLSCALGLPFAGCEVKRICGAVLFAAEGDADVGPRWRVLRHAKIKPHLAQLGLAENTPYALHWTDEVPRLTAPDAYEQYARALEHLKRQQRALMLHQDKGLGLVVIDTVAASCDFPLDTANSAGPNQAVFNVLHRLAREFDCCVMVVDHLGKDATKGTRGSTAKEASADVVWRVTGSVSDDGMVSNTAMTIAKMRGGASGKRLPFTLQPVKMPNKRDDGIVVQWHIPGDGTLVPKQNKRHPMLMRAIDEALLEKFQWVRLDRNVNVKATESARIYGHFKLSFAATVESGVHRENTINKAFNRAMKDSSDAGLIGQKTLSDKTVVVWRTLYKFQDSFVSKELSS
jgi:AAA domain